MDGFLLFVSGAIGCVVGGLAGVFGVGGGFLLVPTLTVFVGVPVELAVGASCCQVLGPATTSLLARSIRFAHLRLAAILSGGLIAGVVLGGSMLHQLQLAGSFGWHGRSIRWADLAVLSSYLVLVLLLAATVAWEIYGRMPRVFRSSGPLGRIRLPPYVPFDESGELVSLPVLCWFGIAVGCVSGLLGMSGGLILFPALIYLWGMPTQAAIRMTLVIVWAISCLGTIVHSWNGYVRLDLVVALLIGGTLGARIGAHLSLQSGARQLKLGFAVLLLITGLIVGCRLWRLLM